MHVGKPNTCTGRPTVLYIISLNTTGLSLTYCPVLRPKPLLQVFQRYTNQFPISIFTQHATSYTRYTGHYRTQEAPNHEDKLLVEKARNEILYKCIQFLTLYKLSQTYCCFLKFSLVQKVAFIFRNLGKCIAVV